MIDATIPHFAPFCIFSNIIHILLFLGNVWYDHPGKTVCLSHGQVGKLHPDDRYDWESFLQFYGARTCLRMSQKGYAKMADIIIE